MFLTPVFWQSVSNWHRRGIAILLGICAAIALPPFYALPFLIPAFAGLFLLLQYAPTRRQAFFDGWWWGFGHFTAGLYWICISLWVEPEKFAWLTPFALFGLPAILAVYTGLVAWLLKLSELRIADRGQRIVVFSVLWVIVEYARAHLFTGFPWNLIGYVWTVSDAMLQFASMAGIYGLSWITVIAASMPSLYVDEYSAASVRRPVIAVVLLLTGIMLFGLWRLETHPTRYTDIKVRIVQANIPQALKWRPNEVAEGLRKHMRITRLPGIESVKLVIWPETAIPYYVSSETSLTRDLGAVLPEGALLLAGGIRNDASRMQVWNSIFAIDGAGRIMAQYDKHHLVPFGEYIPFRGILPVEAVAVDMGDFSRGPGPQTLIAGAFPPFSPLICYEAIFPDEVTDRTGRAQWLLSLTDDAWFGVSSGPYQDVQMARVRAVEQGLPLLRAANTGISGGFDAYGREITSMSLEKEGALDLYLPISEYRQIIFGRYPQSGILFIIAASTVFLCLCSKKRSVVL